MANLIQSIERALRVLLLLNKSTPMTIQNISKSLDIPRTTLYPIINTLEEYGFVTRNETTKNIHIGWQVYELGLNYKEPLDLACRDIARKLRQKWGKSVYVSIYIGDNKIAIILVEMPEKVFYYAPPMGFFTKAHATASGKVLLAHMSQDELAWIHHPGVLTQETLNTIVTSAKLLETLEEVRNTGFATDDEECLPGLGCIAAPIKNILGETIASISISGSKDSVFANSDAIKMDLMNASTQISKSIGLDF